MEVRDSSLPFARVLFVVSSFTPVFLLWAVKGTSAVADKWFVSTMTALIVLPNLALFLRYRFARRANERRMLTITRATDHREHLLVYLFAMLTPLIAGDLSSMRSVLAAALLLSLSVFLFWHLDLHYLNIVFAVMGFKVYAIVTKVLRGTSSSEEQRVLISRRKSIPAGQRIDALAFSDGVFFEIGARS